MDDPRYGTVPPDALPSSEVAEGVTGRVLAGEAFGLNGPFQTVQTIQMVDFELDANAKVVFDVADKLDTAMVYVYGGTLASLNGKSNVANGSVVLLDASSDETRGLELLASERGGAEVMLFAGKKLREPIAWHGPIVMNTQKQIDDTLLELRSGKFPPKRVEWDHKRISSKSSP